MHKNQPLRRLHHNQASRSPDGAADATGRLPQGLSLVLLLASFSMKRRARAAGVRIHLILVVVCAANGPGAVTMAALARAANLTDAAANPFCQNQAGYILLSGNHVRPIFPNYSSPLSLSLANSSSSSIAAVRLAARNFSISVKCL